MLAEEINRIGGILTFEWKLKGTLINGWVLKDKYDTLPRFFGGVYICEGIYLTYRYS